jgi:hypothetical protein
MAASKIISLASRFSISTDNVAITYQQMIDKIPTIWTYNLGGLHMRSVMEPFAASVDVLVDSIAALLFQTVTAEDINHLLQTQISQSPPPRHDLIQKIFDVVGKYAEAEDPSLLFEISHFAIECNIGELKNSAKCLSEEAGNALIEIIKEDQFAQLIRNAERTIAHASAYALSCISSK